MASRVRERPGVDQTSARSRRAFSRRQWSRRWLTWKYVAALLLLVGVLAGGVWLLFFSSAFSVATVEVSGEQSLNDEQVREVAGVTEGAPLARVDLDAVRARVAALAVVGEAEVTRSWPDTVVVRIRERTPVAVVEIGGQLRGLDIEGVVFRDFGSPPPGLPRVETAPDTGRDALREAAGVVSTLPGDLGSRVDHVEVVTVDQISLELRDGRVVVWGSAEESEVKAEVLTALLEQPGETYDVSVPGQPTVSR